MAKRDIHFAVYDKNDNYILGFETIREFAKLMGVSEDSIYHSFCTRGANSEVFEYKGSETIEKSRLVFEYSYKKITTTGTILNSGTKIYQFWEESL